jgi:uncharacterized phage protein (TIGR02216 family)
MAFGLGRLGWAPDQFWKATPREIGAALRAHQQAPAMAATQRTALHELMAAHPDI